MSNKGIDVCVDQYDEVLIEEQVEHSNALQSRVRGRGAAHMGPLARYALNFDKLTPRARQAALDAGLGPVCRNPFRSIVVRAVELVFAFEEALRIIERYREPKAPFVDVPPRSGIARACTEAPRGTLYHRYRIDERGSIEEAKIVAPTSVNQCMIEQDLCHFIAPNLHLADGELQWQCEQAIRNYDPCISCSTHFLRFNIDRC